jgi:hypothetical protein
VKAGPNATIVRYKASVYNTVNSLVRFRK